MKSRKTAALVGLLPHLCLLLYVGCSGGDGGAGSPDAAFEAGRSDASGTQCRGDEECSDGRFCTGIELCEPGNPRADAFGCVPGDLPECDDAIVCTVDECNEERSACTHQPPDGDGDGHADATCVNATGVPLGDDCDDADANRYPGNSEVCNGGDEDCNPSTLGFEDADGDGASSSACCNPQSDGTVSCGPDCDDADAAIRPGIADGPPSACDTIDNDCDGTPDEGCPCVEGLARSCGPAESLARVGVCRPGEQFCVGGAWTSVCTGAILPGEELCDERDNDCDGTVDEGVVRTYYRDGDGDGFGDASLSAQACSAPIGYAALPTDCDDLEPARNPSSPELCDGQDNNCDETVDEGCDCVVGQTRACGASDGAGGILVVGACSAGVQRCAEGLWGECVGAIAPMPESCNGADDDCDGSTDEDVLESYFPDADGDGYGAAGALASLACVRPAGHATSSSDCDEANPGVHPAATEVCDGVDNNCDGVVDPGCACATGETRDCGPRDGVGAWLTAGSCASGLQRCVDGLWGECVGAVNPTAESCNGLDDDCDESTDEGVLTTYYLDADGDGFGALGSPPLEACVVPSDGARLASDCDDGDAAVSPVATDLCDGLDNDCDGAPDEGCECVDGLAQSCGATTDEGVCAIGTQRCIAGLWGACTGSVGPAPEGCDGLDNDCDGVIDNGVQTSFYLDADGDGYGDALAISELACSPPTSAHVSNNRDCDDLNAEVRPGAYEACDGVDNNCSGAPDEGCSCLDGSSVTCGPSTEAGVCAFGTQICVGGVWTDCAGQVMPRVEVCNGLDDDCVNGVDDTFACAAGQTRGCTTTCGGLPGTQTCLADCGGWSACSAPEVCNGCDDDVDGLRDDGFDCTPGEPIACVNACGVAGAVTCSASCTVPACELPYEVCNYCDDDGDGTWEDDRDVVSFRVLDELSCASMTLRGGASCPPFIGGSAVQLLTRASYQARAAWTPVSRMGWGTFFAHIVVSVSPGTSAAPADGWALVLASGPPTADPADYVGTYGGNLGVPLTRDGLSIEWEHYGNDSITLHRIGAGARTLLASYTPVPANLFDGSASDVKQELFVWYTPDDPGIAGSQEHLRVALSYAGPTILEAYGPSSTVYQLCDPMAGCGSSPSLGNEIPPVSEFQMGVTAASGGSNSKIVWYLDRFFGTWTGSSEIWREDACP